MPEEEEVYTYSEVIARIRDKLRGYFRLLAGQVVDELFNSEALPVDLLKSRVSWELPGFHRVGVVDGGSYIVSLNIGYIGIVASIGIILEDNRVAGRIVADPVIVPHDPSELSYYESANLIHSVVDKVREALVFENAARILERGVDLLVVDGPLIPYGAIAKKLVGTKSELEAWKRYHEAVLDLHHRSRGSSTSIVGFVKRPRSRYIALIKGVRGFDHVILSRILEPGEYLPEPPLELGNYPGLFHDRDIASLVAEIKPKTVYLRLTSSSPPYRVDFGSLVVDYRDILSYLYSNRTREGIPYIIMKADEETKITRKLVRELYEDILHDYIVEYVKDNPNLLIPLLPEYGGL